MSAWIKSRIAVAGGTGEIGRCIAGRLAEITDDLTIIGRDREKFDSLFRDDGIRFMDIGDYDGDADIFINCIGAPFFSRSHDFDEESMDMSYLSNFRVPAMLISKTVDAMRKKGRGWIININSRSGLETSAYGALYSPFKFAMRGFADTVRRENCRNGIRVSEIYPGMADTSFIEGMRRKPSRESLISPFSVAEAVFFIINKDVYISEMTIPNMSVDWVSPNSGN